jgi:DnaJ-related protein SCJ1
MDVTLEELYLGKTTEIDISKQVLCDHCFGTGAENSDDVVTCTACSGSGVLLYEVQLGPHMVQQFQQQCDHCQGKGKVIRHVCSVCRGNKVKRGNEQYTISIEKGLKDGSVIVSMHPNHYTGHSSLTDICRFVSRRWIEKQMNTPMT